MTGDGKVSGEAKYKSAKEIIARFKFVFATNFGFASEKYDAGLVNRMLVLPLSAKQKRKINAQICQKSYKVKRIRL